MVYCAAFGCNNKAEKGKGISFFTFPKDVNLRKQWAHYCRRKDFTPTSGHRLCSDHFSPKCFQQDPKLLSEMGLQETFRKRLRINAVPDVPLLTEEELCSEQTTAKVRGAYAKRQKAEIIKEALKKSKDTEKPKDTASAVASKSVETKNKKVQAELRPPQRTRSHQTDFIRT